MKIAIFRMFSTIALLIYGLIDIGQYYVLEQGTWITPALHTSIAEQISYAAYIVYGVLGLFGVSGLPLWKLLLSRPDKTRIVSQSFSDLFTTIKSKFAERGRDFSFYCLESHPVKDEVPKTAEQVIYDLLKKELAKDKSKSKKMAKKLAKIIRSHSGSTTYIYNDNGQRLTKEIRLCERASPILIEAVTEILEKAKDTIKTLRSRPTPSNALTQRYNKGSEIVYS